MVPDSSFPEVLPWLKALPLAPEYRPTLAEFQDPIAYILRIEQEASRYGICKIVPPLPAAPKSTVIANLNHSFCSRSPSGDPTFTTRQQQIGFCPRHLRPVQKSVWQSGNRYTLLQFEAKARSFERSHIRKSWKKKKNTSSSLSPLKVESLFWKVANDKPSTVEYANDMPGSGFAKLREEEAGLAAAENVGGTAWNMRGVARAKGSLLRFMKEEIPGVTSPMVYVAMLFSWFAWHVEDHDLHSLNYLHMGSAKTWYGVPRDVAHAFEEVIRVHGYGGEVNPLITFATLAEKTTLMSPEVLIGSGIPCCRLVQNVGEFVITFPGSYHSGFSHGFNCGEASNIATPAWLKVAKEAAIRRASTNCPPMVSHYQLLYALALSLCSRSPSIMVSPPKSLRLKNKHRCVGETMIKETFVKNVMQNNILLNILLHDGSSCVILPQRTSDDLLYSSLHVKLQMKVKPRIALGLCHGEDEINGDSVSHLSVGSKGTLSGCLNGFIPANENSNSVYQRLNLTTSISVFGSSETQHFSSKMQNYKGQNRGLQTVGILDRGLLSCVTCGILSYSCVAVIQPKETTAGYLMSANSSHFADQAVGFEEKSDLNNEAILKTINSDHDIYLGNKEKSRCSIQVPFSSDDLLFDAKAERGASALALLVSAYGESDSEEDALCDASFCADGNKSTHSSAIRNLCQQSTCPIDYESVHHNWIPSREGEGFFSAKYHNKTARIFTSVSKVDHSGKAVANISCLNKFPQLQGNCSFEYSCEGKMMQLSGNQQDTVGKAAPSRLVECIKMTTDSFSKTVDDVPSLKAWMDLDNTYEVHPPTENLNDMLIKKFESNSHGYYPPGFLYDSTITGNTVSTVFGDLDNSIKNSSMTLLQTSDKNSSRMHVFCLEHAVEVEKRLRPLGGVDLMLLCHPEYPKIESEAKHLAEELGFDHQWKDTHYRDASEEDQEKIRMAIDDKAVVPCNGDWAVKLGINLYFSVNLSQSPLFRKQMPYNEVIYNSFSQKSSVEQDRPASIAGRRKKIIFAGKWCGKVWMSNQVHPYLTDQNLDEETDMSSEPDSCRRTGNRATIPRRNSTNNSAAGRRKSNKKQRELASNSTRKPNCHSRRVKCSDPIKIAEGDYSQCGRNVGGRSVTGQSGTAVNVGNGEKEILSRKTSANSNAADRRKSDKKGIVSAVRSSTMKPGHIRFKNSSDVRYEESSEYARSADDGSEADADIEDDRQALVQRRNSTGFIASARRKSDKNRKKTAVRSSAKKLVTRLEDSTDAGNAGYVDDGDDDVDDGGHNRDGLIEEAILPVRNSSVRNSELETDSDLKKEAIVPGRNLISKSAAARRKSVRKRKRSTNASCARKAAHTRPFSSAKQGYAEDGFSISCGRIISRFISSLKGIDRDTSSMLLRKRWLDSGEAASMVTPEKHDRRKKAKEAPESAPDKAEFPCDVEGCSMSFKTRQDLGLHKRNICPDKGCGKKFFSHKYLLQHKKVHSNDRPLRCPWKGCKMTFKWAWARTEHIRVHTGERPYSCKEPGCSLTFRFVSDFSRHRRKTGH